MSGSAVLASAVSTRSSVDFSRRPMLVFWETTRACLLACRHCRASATTQPPPGELSIRARPLSEIYRDDPLLKSIRAARFTGRCGSCEYADLCGGSRARAFAATGDPLGEDPACPYLTGLQTMTGTPGQAAGTR